MSDSMKLSVAWLLASAAAVFLALAAFPSAFIGGHYIPVGNDAFYHARRILDLIADPSSLHEFDPRVHVPEGTTLIWPWGYDYLMSLLVRVGLALHLGRDAIAVLDHVPVVAFPVCIALVVVVCRQLGVGARGSFVAALATAFFPLNQGLYGIGNVDHHFAEQLFVLASLACALAWLGKGDSIARACALGLIFGVAPCIHNGLFVIQLPLVGVFLWSWIHGRALPRTTWTFAIVLVLVTVAAAAPSRALREGSFAFYTLSWFHVYFAFCVGALCTLLARFPFSKRNVAIVAVAVLAAVAPVASQLLLADRFLSVSVEGAEGISEVQSLWALAANRNSLFAVTGNYSYLVLLLPATMALCAWRALRVEKPDRLFFWLACLFGSVLLALMVRLHVYGSFALCLPWIVLIDEKMASGQLKTSAATATLALIVLAATAATIPRLSAPHVAGNDPYYALTYDLYPAFADACARNPGVALSSLDDGNYIRYHTECSVIANNFLLTAFHESKVREVRALRQLAAKDLASRAPNVRYVYVRRESLFQLDSGGRLQFLPSGDPSAEAPLVVELLAASPTNLPDGFTLLKELAFERPSHAPYARLFSVEAAPTRSASR